MILVSQEDTLGQAFGKLPFISFSVLAASTRFGVEVACILLEQKKKTCGGSERLGKLVPLHGGSRRFLEGSGWLVCLWILLFPGETAG